MKSGISNREDILVTIKSGDDLEQEPSPDIVTQTLTDNYWQAIVSLWMLMPCCTTVGYLFDH